MIEPHALKKCLNDLKLDIPENEIDRFIRFLDKDNRSRIDYYWFLN
jgi:Ca2+-binding EF-hand superfamily protein